MWPSFYKPQSLQIRNEGRNGMNFLCINGKRNSNKRTRKTCLFTSLCQQRRNNLTLKQCPIKKIYEFKEKKNRFFPQKKGFCIIYLTKSYIYLKYIVNF